MDSLTTLASTLAKLGAPVLGGALGGPAGAALATTIVGALAEALGTEPTPAAVEKALGEKPEAKTIAKQVEADRGAAVMEEVNAYLRDVQDARATTVKLAEQGSKIAWGAPVVSVMVVAGFIGLTTLITLRAIPDSQLLLVLFGALSAAFGQVVNYWLGSSAGSANKDSLLGKLIVR